MRTTFLAALSLALVASQLHAQSRDCRYSAERSATVNAAGARLLDVDAGAGGLRIEGKPGLTEVRIRGHACASDEDLLDDIKLEARREGDRVVVKANKQDHNNWHFGNHIATLDVVMEVPAGMTTTIDDGSGELYVSGLGNTDIDDGSGEIEGHDLGAVHLDDGSGGITLTDIRGAVEIEDGSGEIELRNIGGAIDIDDGSGEINVRGARNNVRVSDSSGNISVIDVAGDFIVRDDGSGDIDYENVRGRVDIPRKHRDRN